MQTCRHTRCTRVYFLSYFWAMKKSWIHCLKMERSVVLFWRWLVILFETQVRPMVNLWFDLKVLGTILNYWGGIGWSVRIWILVITQLVLCFYFCILLGSPSNCRNTNGRLWEQEMLWEHERTGECFHSFFRVVPNFHECFYLTIGLWAWGFYCVIVDIRSQLNCFCINLLAVQNFI